MQALQQCPFFIQDLFLPLTKNFFASQQSPHVTAPF
jgi:hypothetical protein